MKIEALAPSITQVHPDDNFSLAKTVTCGQCFRWHQISPNAFYGVHAGLKVIVMQLDDNSLIFSAPYFVTEEIWVPYFGLDENYSTAIAKLDLDPFARRATEASDGIHILRQDPWEMLISYIISQNNNIDNIGKTVDRIAEAVGHPANGERPIHDVYAFPSPEELLSLSNAQRDELRLGFRYGYVFRAAEYVYTNKQFLKSLAELPTPHMLNALQHFNGIGPKVANCIALFGYHRMDAFPIDLHIQRIADEHYDGRIDIAPYGNYAGLIQQYMFHYTRNLGGN